GGPYVAASFLARVALYAQIPAAAYALRKAAVAGPRVALPRSLLLALGPGLLVAGAMAVFPGPLLDLTYGGRYLQATGLVRVLGVALFLSGLAQVLIQLLMGAGRTAWVWSSSAVSIVGLAALFLFAEVGFALAWTMVAVHAAVLSVAVLHLRRALAAERGAEGAVLVLNWRDTKHPQGGGCEVYVEETARRLAAMGRRVTMFCADHGEAPRDEVVDGIRYIRRGTWRSVYLWAAAYHLLGRFGPHDVVLDVQNGVPFFSPLYCGRPVVVMVTHVHREQWGMVFGPLTARIGWWLESRLAPRVYRRASYIAISQATRDGLAAIGVAPERTAVVLAGGAEALEQPPTGAARGAEPSIAYLGRLVPNKRIELIIDALAALREDVPGLRLRVMGQGYWEDELRAHAERRGVAGSVVFEGFVDEETKRRILAESWVLTLTSVQEGWGIVVLEAAAQRTPTVAMRVGALSESVVDGETGLLADDFEGFVENLRRVLDRPDLRERLGEAASAHARRFTWDATAAGFDEVLTEAVARHGRDPVGSGALDPDPAPTAIPFVADI
ncbi:MAG: glycosyltransferase, partial [Actinobacteria bacterium]|nr:glycosyltransferase [Actinomycetota bacterium]